MEKNPNTHTYIELVLKCITALPCVFVPVHKRKVEGGLGSKYLHGTSSAPLNSVQKAGIFAGSPQIFGFGPATLLFSVPPLFLPGCTLSVRNLCSSMCQSLSSPQLILQTPYMRTCKPVCQPPLKYFYILLLKSIWVLAVAYTDLPGQEEFAHLAENKYT